jgi:hypothetical protein
MPDQPSAARHDVPEADEVASNALATLMERHPALVSLDELVLDLCRPGPGRSLPPLFVREGLDELVRAGLAHQLGHFYFASHTAVRGQELRQ